MPITGLPTTTGNDTVTVTAGDWVSADGQAGNDLLVVDYSGLSTDVRQFYTGNGWSRITDDLRSGVDYAGFDRFSIRTGSGDDAIYGADLADSLNGGGGNDVLTGGLGADTIVGGSGHDRWIANLSSLSAAVSVQLVITGTADVGGTGGRVTGIEALSLTTGSGDDRIVTSAFIGNDTVSTGGGNDTVQSGRGRDQFDGGADIDLLIMDWSGITDPNHGIAQSYLGNGWSRFASASGDRMDYAGIERFNLTGGAGSDTLIGGNLNDTLTGNGGNDVLNGGQGTDRVAGGEGVDLWIVNTSALAGPVAVRLTDQTTTYGATLAGIERINYIGGLAADTVLADERVFNDHIVTGGGDDVVSTGRGVDVVDGGNNPNGVADNDLLIMDWSGIADPRHAIAQSYLGNGWSRFRSDSGDMLDYAGIERFRLTGGAGNDTLVGGAANDTLRGGDGDDWLNMGEGAGTADGGAGNDRLVANLAARGAAIFSALDSQTTAQLGAIGLAVTGIEQVTLTTGSRADNLSTAGFALSDQFNAGAGNDTVNPGLGQDTVDGGVGTDLLVLDWGAAASNIASVYLGNGWSRYYMADGSSAVDFAGIDRFQLTGGQGHDVLSGGALNDTLTGGGGNDILIGDAGRDVIQGGSGTDQWRGNAGAASDALSLVMSSAGNGTLTGIGTTLKSIESVVLTTGAGNDTLNLGALSGDDALTTGNGDDVIDIGRGLRETVDAGNGTDVLTADFGLATTSVRMFYNGNGWTAAEAIGGDYRLDFAGVERLNLTGGSRNDRLYGFDGGDTLNGAGGADQLNGGMGDDLLTGGAGSDTFIFSSLWSAGQDRITDASAGDFLRFSGLDLTGSVVAGNGAGLLQGQVAVQIGGGSAVVRVGLDALAGADFVVTLDGAFALSNFLASGNDLLIV